EEVNAKTIDLGAEVRKLVEPLLALDPIVRSTPMSKEELKHRPVGAVGPTLGDSVIPPCELEPGVKIPKRLWGGGDQEGSDLHLGAHFSRTADSVRDRMKETWPPQPGRSRSIGSSVTVKIHYMVTIVCQASLCKPKPCLSIVQGPRPLSKRWNPSSGGTFAMPGIGERGQGNGALLRPRVPPWRPMISLLRRKPSFGGSSR